MGMGTAYLVATLLGGALLAGSLFWGGEDELDDGGHEGIDGDADGHSLADFWLPFASLRFWTFVLAFGGLTGTLLTFFDLAPVSMTAILAVVVGLVSGSAMWWAVRRLRRDDVDSAMRPADFLGASAKVLLPVARGRAGKVRVALGGRDVDVMAETEDDGELASDGEVLVYDVRDDGVVLVTREEKRRRVES